MHNTRKLILYIAASLDGFIAAPNDDLSFLKVTETEGEDYGYAEFVSSVDTVIMGRKTYDWVMKQLSEFPHSDKKTFIITHTEKPKIGNITFYNGNLKDLIIQLKQANGKNIFCDGGAEIVNELLKYELIDEMIIFTFPILLGGGTRLFQGDYPEQKLELISSKSYPKGIVKLHHKKVEK